MVEQALDSFGGLHAVINPAGILRDGMFHKMSEEDWDKVIEVHLRGTFNVCRATIEHFRNQEDGAYVLYTSTSGIIGNIGQTNYGAAKMGIAGLSRIIAMEGAAKNVRCNCLAPVAWTRMTQSVPVRDEASAARRAQMAESIRADQPARFCVALLADAAKHVTGQIFGASGENIILYSQPRPIETVTKAEGWTIETILSEALPKMQDKFYSLARLPLPPTPRRSRRTLPPPRRRADGRRRRGAGRLEGRSTIVTGAAAASAGPPPGCSPREGARVLVLRQGRGGARDRQR